MSIFDLYSKRRKRELGQTPDVYQYDEIPHALRVQIVHIWRAAFGDPGEFESLVPKLFELMHDILCREYGRFTLSDRREGHYSAVVNFMIQTSSTDEVLDVVELSFRVLDKMVREHPRSYGDVRQTPDDAIEELNSRFKEHGVGFQYQSELLIRVDSQLIHSEVTRPALIFLSGKDYIGPNQEFLSAHEHYRHHRHKECLNECLKAFESTIKAICTKRKWDYRPTDTAKPLLDVIFTRGLIPPYMQSHFTGLRSTLEAGVPTVRNKLGGHGQGATQVNVPEYVVSYVLHLTAANIVFLIGAEADMP